MILSMVLRVLLAIAMVMPAAPPPSKGECPFTTIEECRAWLDACCGAGDRLEEFCAITCDDATEKPDETEDCCFQSRAMPDESSGCCRASDDAAPDSPCCSAKENPAGCDVETSLEDLDCSGSREERNSGSGRSCIEHASGRQGFRCEWCCCCPVRPNPIPSPPQAPAPARVSVERIKAQALAKSAVVDAGALVATSRVERPFDALVPSNSRQSVLCVWRE